MDFFISILKGIAIGAGAILPGISSGVLCVIFGIYEKLVNSVLGLFKDFKKNFVFILPLVIGGFIGFIIFGNILKYLFYTYEIQTKLLFIGLIIGSIPSLLKEANSKNKFCLHHFIYTIIAFLLTLFLLRLESTLSAINFSNSTNSYFLLILSGFCMSAGIIIPGVSSSVILMSLNTYYIYLEAVSNLNLFILFPMGLGCVIGCIIFLLLIKFLLSKYYTQTFYSIIGFVIGSIFVLIPSNILSIFNLIFVFIGFIVAIKFEN